MRMRGHDLTGGSPAAAAAAHAEVKGGITSASSPHASSPQHAPLPPKLAEHMSKEGEEIWRQEQAMKKQLDADTSRKGGSLWKQTVDIVHSTDPNAKLISKLRGGEGSEESGEETSTIHGPHHAKHAAVRRIRIKSMSMKARLERELNDRVQAKLGTLTHQDLNLGRKNLEKSTKGHVEETAQAHAKMPLSSMKQILKNQLDTSVNSVVSRAKQLSSFSSNAQLKKRLKAELDKKADEQQKQLLRTESARESLAKARGHLKTKVSRAQAVRDQLTKEMREENAIRRQLDMEAHAQGQKMLKNEISHTSSKTSAPHLLTKNAMEETLRKQLDSKTEARKKAISNVESTNQDVRKDFGKLGESQRHNLEAYLRNKLKSNDGAQQEQMYKKSLAGNLLKPGVNHGGNVVQQNHALHDAEMKLFKESMAGAVRHEQTSQVQMMSDKKEGQIMHTEKGLLVKVLSLTKGENKGLQTQDTQTVHDMAHASGHTNGLVHDMAHANAAITYGLGHQHALAAAKGVEQQIVNSRKKLIKFASKEDDEAVE